MRPFLLLLVGLLLAGVGQGALAASYVFSDSAQSESYVALSPDCSGVVRTYLDARNGVEVAQSTGGGSYFYFNSSGCSGHFRSVGDAIVFTMRVINPTGARSNLSVTLSLSAIVADDSSDEVAGIPLQRVVLMIGCALMFGIGMVVGKA